LWRSTRHSELNWGDKDSDKRQRVAIESFAKRAGFALVGEFSDPGVSGADPIEARPGFSSLLDRIEGNGVRVVICEDASRFARELVTQELGIIALIRRNVRVLTANGDDLTDSSDPSRKMMRQMKMRNRIGDPFAILRLSRSATRRSDSGCM
jgi:DNA invertase Pin-like site-specific DNA recombinase